MIPGHYEAETLIENRLDAPLKPIVGTDEGRKWPLILTNDNIIGFSHSAPESWWNPIYTPIHTL
jgi:hypothetical protein